MAIGRIEITSTGVTQALIGLRARALRLADLRPEMEKASDMFYAETQMWYESEGGGTWPPLAASTVAGKVSSGSAQPSKPLVDQGNLRESAISPNGPYSGRIVDNHSAIMTVDWAEGGWQIPQVLALGTAPSGPFPRGGHPPGWMIPARPIWPKGHAIDELRKEIGDMILLGI